MKSNYETRIATPSPTGPFSRHPEGGTCPGCKPDRQRGVALVTALLVVSLATVAAVAMAVRFQLDMRRTANLLNGEQAYAYAVAAEDWAYVILRRDRKESQHDSLDEDWSTCVATYSGRRRFRKRAH